MNVWKFTGSTLSNKELSEALADLAKVDADLVYYSSTDKLTETDNISNNFEIKLVDVKTTYVKQLKENPPASELITPYTKSYPEKELIELAIQSGAYSRFKVDKRFPEASFRELYELWMVNSVTRKIANEVLVYTEQNLIQGFVTLGEKNNRADLGIMAVNANSRGRGIGKALINAAENWFYHRSYSNIQAVTQADNTPACRQFESCQYEIDTVEYFYHIWRT
jgi:dTDP-4-amino-4,6-dideoxy-D-galactose acyltransferase